MAIGELQVLSSVNVDEKFSEFLVALKMHEQQSTTLGSERVNDALFQLGFSMFAGFGKAGSAESQSKRRFKKKRGDGEALERVSNKVLSTKILQYQNLQRVFRRKSAFSGLTLSRIFAALIL
jgi:hypothetical protein